MDEQCVFCRIVSGALPSSKLYEDDRALALLDIFPVSRGHALVIPKAHVVTMWDISDEDLARVMWVAKRVGAAIRDHVAADGMNFLQSNGTPAGQLILHWHMHLMPRFWGDGLTVQPPPRNEPSEDLDAMAAAIRARIK